MSQRKKERIREAILKLRKSGTNPTPARVSFAMGRQTLTLNGEESFYRREILADLDNDTILTDSETNIPNDQPVESVEQVESIGV